MNDNKNSFNNRTLLGIVLIVIGGIYLFSTIGIINLNVPRIIFSLPFWAFVWGVIILINSRNKAFGLLLIFLGALFLIPKVFPNISYSSDLFFPIVIIAFGFYIMFKRNINWGHYHGRVNKQLNKDQIDDISIFGGGHKVIVSDNFQGGNITAIFGGSEIDLSNCKLAEGENVIDVLIMFGGTSIFVPKEWNININVTPLFGGFSNKYRREFNGPFDMTRTLVVKGVAIFGGGEIKYI
ncbi:MAG TPA: LiaF domain-containing protein [Ignavibacteriaceae bacterium]|nr:LiaF domain-containing protein [Ignavibacteriaceae bacterium]